MLRSLVIGHKNVANFKGEYFISDEITNIRTLYQKQFTKAMDDLLLKIDMLDTTK